MIAQVIAMIIVGGIVGAEQHQPLGGLPGQIVIVGHGHPRTLWQCSNTCTRYFCTMRTLMPSCSATAAWV